MGFVFRRGDDLQEPFHIVGGDAAGDGLFEFGQVPMHTSGNGGALRGRRDDEGAAIGGADVARDEAARGEPIEDAGQRRSLVGEAAMESGDRRRTGGRQQRQDVRLALRQTVVTQIGQIEADPVRRSMNRWNQAQ